MDKEKRIINNIQLLSDHRLMIDTNEYAIVSNYRDAFDLETFSIRYSEILERYDYIVGDIGYEQLRLRGFFRSDNTKAPLEWRIDTLEDYLLEYCNFGCPYFVLERLTGEAGVYRRPKKSKQEKKGRTKNNRKKTTSTSKNNKVQNQSYIYEKKGNISQNKLKIKQSNKEGL